VRARAHAIEPEADGVRVRTSAGDLRCARCVVCAGAGTERLLAPLGIDLRRERRAAFRLTFRLTAPAAAPMPVWGDASGRFGEGAYGTPEGLDRYAVGLTATTQPLDAPGAESLPAGAVDVRAARRRLIAYVRAAMPGLDPDPVDGMLRLITPLRGPDEDALGLWQHDGVLAFAGHNLFKHAPRLGELLADAALGDGPPDPRLRPPA
jgi:glycine/D-amino acid oxidase-like deaminating enzyme